VFAAGSDQNSKLMLVKNPDEILLMQEANQIVAEALAMLEKVVEPGITTWELDRLSEDLCIRRNAIRHSRVTEDTLRVSVFLLTKRSCMAFRQGKEN